MKLKGYIMPNGIHNGYALGVIMKVVWILLISLIFANAHALDIRDMVGNDSESRLTKIISPDSDIFGIPFGTSEDDFIKNYGNPTGYILINKTDTGMIYGKTHFFFFKSKKLSGVRITSSIIDWQISKEILANTPFDRIEWKLDNGIHKRSSLTEVKEILGEKLKENQRGYLSYYITEKSRVELTFSHYVNNGETDDAYHVAGITVKQK